MSWLFPRRGNSEAQARLEAVLAQQATQSEALTKVVHDAKASAETQRCRAQAITDAARERLLKQEARRAHRCGQIALLRDVLERQR